MDNKPLRYIFFLLLVLLSTDPQICSARNGPSVKAVDSTITCFLFQRELHLEIARSPSSKCQEAMELYILDKHQNNRSYLKNKGFRNSGAVYRYQWSQLSCAGKRLVINNIFPKDKLTDKGWKHQIMYSGSHGETLWRIAVWFSGSGTNSKSIAKSNKIDPDSIPVGKAIYIEPSLLDPCFKNITETEYPYRSGELLFKIDSHGEFAEFRLPGGQAIYSQVLKFTPRVTAKEVLEASEKILKRSNLKDFRTIPADFVLKIPSELISPQFLPPGNPRRVQYDATARETEKFVPRETANSLKGVTVFLDAGHGGKDPGAIGKGNVKEDEYAYDVMCRVKRILETETKAAVFVTIRDMETGFNPRDTKLLNSGKNDERIQTHPDYLIQDVGVALNLRWMYCNYLFEKNCNVKSRDEKVVFTSFHADSLHPNASGLMVYFPGADYYHGSIRKNSKVYSKRKESKGQTTVKTSRSSRLKAEGYSKALAQKVEDQCSKMQLKMHSDQPVRKYVIRRGKAWVPAILRYTKIPTRILIELANLQNSEDIKRIKDPTFREQLARMYVDALIAHFSQE